MADVHAVSERVRSVHREVRKEITFFNMIVTKVINSI